MIDGVQHKHAIIREAIVEDLLQVSASDTGLQETIKLLTSRIVRIGNIDKPDTLILAKLTHQDFEILLQTANKLDEETRVDIKGNNLTAPKST